MSEFFLTFLASYGLCFGLMNEKAAWFTRILRRIPLSIDDQGQTLFTRMLQCPYCTGFHTGYIVWLTLNAQRLITAPEWSMVGSVLASAFASSAVCYILDVATEWFEYRPGEGT